MRKVISRSSINNCGVHLSLVAILFTVCALLPPCEASINCYSTVKTEQLITENGEFLVETCNSPTSTCYETYEKDEHLYKKHAIYRASCAGDCNNPKEFCRPCNTTMCNNIYAAKIKTHRQCYQGAGEPDCGLRTEYCSNSVAQCFYEEFEIDDNKVRFFAGCGIGGKCNGQCHVCNTDLCNVPPKLQKVVQQRRQEITERLAKAANGKSGTAAVTGENSNGTDKGDPKSNGASSTSGNKLKSKVDTDNKAELLEANLIALLLFPVIAVCIREISSSCS